MASQKAKNKVLDFPSHSANLYNAEYERGQNIIGEKITEARTQAGLTRVAFRSLLSMYGIDISTQAILKWENGKSSPNAYQLLAIGQALQIDPDFTFFMSNPGTAHSRSDDMLLNPEGIKKLNDYREDLIASGRYAIRSHVSNSIQFKDMPVSDLRVSAGTGAFLDEENFEMVSYPVASIPKDADFGIRVSGDSMEPVYHDGQIVWVQKCQELNHDEVGIFIYDNEGYVKAYEEQVPAKEIQDRFTDSYGTVHMQPVMVSYNQDYAPKVVSPDSDFRIIGRVL